MPLRPALLLAALLAWPAAAGAEADHVPIADNYSDAELVGIGVIVGVDITMLTFGQPLSEWRGDPRIGDPWDWDADISEALYPGTDAGRFLAGIPDATGEYIAPAIAIGAYAADALALNLNGKSISGNVNADHELLGFIEAYGIVVGVTQATKLAVGRERPVYHFGQAEPPPHDPEVNFSFFSLHASSSFCLAAYVSRDLGDYLVHEKGAGVFTGRVLPSVGLYGAAAMIGLSRIIDQKHYFTDVALGSVVGTLTGNLVYALHFDGAGRPRRRHGTKVELIGVPGGLGIAGEF